MSCGKEGWRMERRLFLTGPAGCGKSEAIRSILGPALLGAGGFVTLTAQDASGAPLRCSLLPAAAAGGAEGFAPLPYLDLAGELPLHDNGVFRVEGVRLLQEAAWYPFAVLDAIGGFELLIPQFRAALAELLNGELPLLGVLMDRREAEALCRRLGLSERVQANIAQLWKALRADPDTRIADLNGLRRRASLRALEQWAEEYAR